MQTEIASTVRKLNRLHISCVPFGEKELLDKGAQGAPFHLEDIFESLALRLVLAAIPWGRSPLAGLPEREEKQ